MGLVFEQRIDSMSSFMDIVDPLPLCFELVVDRQSLGTGDRECSRGMG